MAKPTVTNARSFTAAGRRIDLTNKADTARGVRPAAEWQKEAFVYLKEVGEVAYAANYIGQALGQERVFAGEAAEDPADPPVETTNAAAIAAVADLDEGEGWSTLMSEIGVNFQLPGECYLVGRTDPDQGQIWEIRSVSEIQRKDKKIILRDTPGDRAKGIELDQGADSSDFLARLWIRDPEWSDLPTSPLRPVLGECEELLLIARLYRSHHRQRLSAPILGIPSEASFGPDDPTRDGESDDDDPFTRDFFKHASEPIDNEGAASAVIPIMLRLPAELLKEVRAIDASRDIADLTPRETALIRRLAQGVNLPVEVLLGIASANHWGGGVIEEQTYRAHIEPISTLIRRSLTRAYLWPTLKSAGVQDYKRYSLLSDPSAFVSDPDLVEKSTAAHGAIVISDARHRADLGYTEDDAPTPEEVEQRAARTQRAPSEPPATIASAGFATSAWPDVASVAPRRSFTRLELVDELEDLLNPEFVRSVREGRPVTAAASNLGRDLLALDRDLRSAIHASAERLHDAALTKAGARIRSKAKGNRSIQDAIGSTDNGTVALALGPALVRSLGFEPDALLSGAFDALEKPFVSGCRRVGDAALDRVPRLSAAAKDIARTEQDRDIAEAWVWLSAALSAELTDALFTLHVEPTEGETDGSAVSLQIIREAMARAGGGQQGETAAFKALFSVLISGGMATGRFMRGLFAEKGIVAAQWQWEYGAYFRQREFRPHRALNGVPFVNFDDEVLVNPNSFPPDSHYVPGDHEGCRCDVLPLFSESEPEE